MASYQLINDVKIQKAVAIKPNESAYLSPYRIYYKKGGRSMYNDCLKVHDCVVIIVYNTDQQKLLFVRQLRPSLFLSQLLDDSNIDISRGYTIEACSGIVDKPGKTLAEIAKEEVLEELGYDVPTESLQFLCSTTGSEFSTVECNLFFTTVRSCQKVSSGGGVGDEQISIIELDLESARKMIWCKDSAQSVMATSLGLCWFFNEYLPNQHSGR